MFLFIVYGVGPRHCQNMGCSKSTAKAQLWDTPSVKLTDIKVGKPVHPLPCSAAATFLSLTLGSGWLCLWLTTVPQQHLPHGRLCTSHTSHFQEGGWAVLPQSHGSWVLRISWEPAVHLRKWAKTLSWLNPPDSSLSPRISLQQQFSLCTSTSWLQTVLRSLTKQSEVLQCLDIGQSNFLNTLQLSYICFLLRISHSTRFLHPLLRPYNPKH